MSFYTRFAEYYEKIFPFREATFGFLDAAMGSGTTPLIDLGCSIGDYCGHFARGGREIIGVDLDSGMIDRARHTWPGIDFRCMSLCRITEFERRFAGAYSIGNVITHVDPRSLSDFLTDLHDVLEPGSPWVFQIVNCDPVLNLESYDFPPLDIGEGVVFQRAYREISGTGLKFLTSLEAEGSVLFSGEIDLFPLSSEGYRELHEAAGFRLRAHYRDFQGGDFDPRRFGGSVFVFERLQG